MNTTDGKLSERSGERRRRSGQLKTVGRGNLKGVELVYSKGSQSLVNSNRAHVQACILWDWT